MSESYLSSTSLPRLGLFVLCYMTYVYRVGRHCGGQLCHLPESHNGSLHWVPGKPSIGHKWGMYCCLGCLQCKRLVFLVYLLTPLITWTVQCEIVVCSLLILFFYVYWLFTKCILFELLTMHFEVHLSCTGCIVLTSSLC